MICVKCNHRLPDDSEFCQYCGATLNSSPSAASKPTLKESTPGNTSPTITATVTARKPDIKSEISRDAANTIVKVQAKRSIKTKESNLPQNKRDANFGLVPNKKVFCKECASEIDSKTKQCTGCGKQYYRIRFRPIFVFFMLVLLIFGFFGYSYFRFTHHLNKGEFIKAERYFNCIPYGEDLFVAQSGYLKAGILFEEGEYIKAYNAFKKIQTYSVPVSVIDEIKEKIYSLGQTKYRAGDYTGASLYFTEIPYYRQSNDYLFLIDCRNYVYGSSYAGSQVRNMHYKTAMALLSENFENVDEIILENDILFEMFLTSRWEDGDSTYPHYFELNKRDVLHAQYNLPSKDIPGDFWLDDGVYMVGESSENGVKVFRFSVVDEDTIEIYCFKDGTSYTLYRQ